MLHNVKSSEITRLLISKGADVKATDNYNRTPLHYAARSDNSETAEIYINNGAEIDSKDNYNRTPLYYAVREGNKSIVNLLLAKGADVKARIIDIGYNNANSFTGAGICRHLKIRPTVANGIISPNGNPNPSTFHVRDANMPDHLRNIYISMFRGISIDLKNCKVFRNMPFAKSIGSLKR